MLDPKAIRQDLETVAGQLKTRGVILDIAHVQTLEEKRKTLQIQLQERQSERNTQSKAVGIAKAKGENAEALFEKVKEINIELSGIETAFEVVQSELNDLLSRLPNLPQASVPLGKDEEDNKLVRSWGVPPTFDFTPKDHAVLGESLGMDFATASKLSGARFVILKGSLAKLHRALAQFMLDIHTEEHGYQEIYVPYLVNNDSLFGTGQLPNLKDDLFSVQGPQGLSLIPTSEVSITNTVRDDIIEASQLPLKYVCHSPCFRSEAGSYGQDTKGMIRQHQFDKVELVQIVHPDKSNETHEAMTQHAETILQRLELPYRVMLLCTGDMGFSSSKTYDLEVWLPGQGRFREISSCSNTEAFQARRMKARFRDLATGKPDYLHTLNGSALAVGRTLVAVLENYQEADGRIRIPAALQSYMSQKKYL